jgi:hypothetical protein
MIIIVAAREQLQQAPGQFENLPNQLCVQQHFADPVVLIGKSICAFNNSHVRRRGNSDDVRCITPLFGSAVLRDSDTEHGTEVEIRLIDFVRIYPVASVVP